MRRRDFLILAASAGAMSTVARAQSSTRPLVGWLAGPNTDPRSYEAFDAGLAEHGWIAGENVEVVVVHTDLENGPANAADLVSLGPDVLFGFTTPPVLFLMQAAPWTMPVVFSNVVDPVRSGLVDNIANPGGNVTGIMFTGQSWATKRVELLRAAAPRLQHLAYLYDPEISLAHEIEGAADAAGAFNMDLANVAVRWPSNSDVYRAALADVASGPNTGLLVDVSAGFWSDRVAIVEAVREVAVSAVYPWRDYVSGGGLMAYGPDVWESIRLGGTYVGRILNGAWPGDLPVQAATRTMLSLNLAAAAALGFDFPLELLATANEVVE